MSLADHVGRICVKLAGRDAGRMGVIVAVVDKKHVMVTGPPSLTGLRRRKVNITHITLTDRKIEIEPGSSDEDVLKTLEANGLKEWMVGGVKV
ncbi:MAG: 50S ribosomal protein L14e [Nitrososphaerota archaeon]